jgi:tripartite-type tricarboxylate transporter receptor subunit TctC
MSALLVAVPYLSVSDAAAQYFKGKTVTVIAPVPGGSGLDRMIRSFAHHWKKHIPGNPNVIVRNMPGAGGAQPLNFVYEIAKPDGLTLTWGPWNAAGILAGSPGLRYKPEKFAVVGTGHAYYMTLIRTDVAPGLKKPSDIVKAKKFNVGGRRADRNLDLLGNLTMEMIGAKYRFIGGYRGMAKINPAMRANEVQAANSGHVGYHVFFKDNMIREGKAMVLWTHPNFDDNGNPVASKAFPSIKAFHEVYREVHGKLPSGPLWEAYKWYSSVIGSTTMMVFAAPGTPKAILADLRKGHAATSKDKAYLAGERKRMGVPIRFLSAEYGEEIVKSFRNVDPKILAVLKKMAKVGQE